MMTTNNACNPLNGGSLVTAMHGMSVIMIVLCVLMRIMWCLLWYTGFHKRCKYANIKSLFFQPFQWSFAFYNLILFNVHWQILSAQQMLNSNLVLIAGKLLECYLKITVVLTLFVGISPDWGSSYVCSEQSHAGCLMDEAAKFNFWNELIFTLLLSTIWRGTSIRRLNRRIKFNQILSKMFLRTILSWFSYIHAP